MRYSLLGGLGHVISPNIGTNNPSWGDGLSRLGKGTHIFAGVAIAIFNGLKRSIGIVVHGRTIMFKETRLYQGEYILKTSGNNSDVLKHDLLNEESMRSHVKWYIYIHTYIYICITYFTGQKKHHRINLEILISSPSIRLWLRHGIDHHGQRFWLLPGRMHTAAHICTIYYNMIIA